MTENLIKHSLLINSKECYVFYLLPDPDELLLLPPLLLDPDDLELEPELPELTEEPDDLEGEEEGLL